MFKYLEDVGSADRACVMYKFIPSTHQIIQHLVDPVQQSILNNGDAIEIENDFHVTALYGLLDDDPLSVRNHLFQSERLTLRPDSFLRYLTVEGVSLFENEKYDVLKLDVSSWWLDDFHTTLKELPNDYSFDDYRPHLTIAYIRSGEGQKYLEDETLLQGLVGSSLWINTVVHSGFKDVNGNRVETRLI